MIPTPAADETRARIVAEAERLFRHYGYSKTTVADIADACAMSSANVYRFFASKSAINEAIFGVIISELEVQLHQIASADAPASERLTQLIETLAHYTTEALSHEKLHEMAVVAMEQNWCAFERHLDFTEALIASIIASGVESGEFRRQDPKKAAPCVHFALVGLKHPVVAAQRRRAPDTPTPSEMAAFILSALKA